MKYKKLEVKRKHKDGVIEIDEDKLVDSVSMEHGSADVDGEIGVVQVRGAGDFEDKGFFLSGNYDWVLGVDNMGIQVLVPLKKR